MTEHWIVYDQASGAVLWRGSGPEEASRVQELPEGAALLVVPFAVVSKPEIDLDALKATVFSLIDARAEVVRMRFLTPGAGQAITYTRKEAEARAYLIDASTMTPFLVAEADARELTVGAVAAEVIAMADAWVVAGAAIEAARLGAKSEVAAATTLKGIVDGYARALALDAIR